MRDPLELLAALTSRGLDLGHIPGGAPSDLFEILAGALGSMRDRFGAAMIESKFLQYASSLRDLRAWWLEDVVEQFGQEGKSADGRYQAQGLKGLADFTLAEWLDPQRCRGCRGNQTVKNEGGKVVTCPACGGSGLRNLSLRAEARLLADAKGPKYSPEGYRGSRWPARVDWCRHELRRRELAAAIEFAENLRPGFIRAVTERMRDTARRPYA